MALPESIESGFEGLSLSLNNMYAGIVVFIPKLLVALIILILGWVVGAILGRFVAQIIAALKIDKLLEKVGIGQIVSRAGFRLNTGTFLGKLVEWFVIIVFLIAATDVLNLPQVTEFLRTTVLGYIPNVIVAAFILVIAAVIADAAQKLVVGSAKAGGLPSSQLLGGVAKWAIWVFAIIAALTQLGIAVILLETLFTGFVAMLAIAGGVAFGLGGRDAAARYIERLRGDIK